MRVKQVLTWSYPHQAKVITLGFLWRKNKHVKDKLECFFSSFFDSEHNLQLSEWEINLTSFIGEMSCLAQPMIQTNDSQINSD